MVEGHQISWTRFCTGKGIGMENVADNLSKRYGQEIQGVRDLSLNLAPRVLGLLGPNGAGKSTLMTLIATITQSTRWQVTGNGINLRDQPNQLQNVSGSLSQEFGVYPPLSGVEFLGYLAAQKNLSPAECGESISQLLDLVNLGGARDAILWDLGPVRGLRMQTSSVVSNPP